MTWSGRGFGWFLSALMLWPLPKNALLLPCPRLSGRALPLWSYWEAMAEPARSCFMTFVIFPWADSPSIPFRLGQYSQGQGRSDSSSYL